MAFLNGDNLKRIWYPFYPRVTWVRSGIGITGKPNITKKNIIPIGVHELEIAKVKDLKTKKGWRKVELWLYCKPYQVYDYDVSDLSHTNKSSFDYIICTHVLAHNPMGIMKNEWFKTWTMCLGASDLDKMLTWEGKKFKAVIMHIQEKVKENGAYKMNELGEEVVYWQPKVLSVHKLDEDVKFDYNNLFRPIRYDPIEDCKTERHVQLFQLNTAAITHGEKEDIIPF
jgi:hypothetical protein